MGEIADAMINGEMCAGCGVYLDSGDMGIPMFCSAQCARNQGVLEKDIKNRLGKEL